MRNCAAAAPTPPAWRSASRNGNRYGGSLAAGAGFVRPTELERLALALLVPEGRLARVAVLRAGRVPLEEAVPGDGDLVGAVRVLFQHVARDIAGPVLDIEGLFRSRGNRKADQEKDHGKPRGP